MRTSAVCAGTCVVVSAATTSARITRRAELKRFDDDKDDDTDQDQGWQLVQPAVENMSMHIAVVSEIKHDFPAVQVLDDQYPNQSDLGKQPAALEPEADPQPYARYQRQD